MFFTKDGSVYEKRSYVIAEVFDNYNLMSRAYYFSKYPKYLKGLESGEFVKAHWVTAITEMMNLINQYDVKEVVAYNLAFDLRAIKKTNEYIRNKEFKLFDNLKQECLWNKAVETICQQKSTLLDIFLINHCFFIWMVYNPFCHFFLLSHYSIVDFNFN